MIFSFKKMATLVTINSHAFKNLLQIYKCDNYVPLFSCELTRQRVLGRPISYIVLLHFSADKERMLKYTLLDKQKTKIF